MNNEAITVLKTPVSADSCVVFERPDTTGATQCEGCGGWIIGGTTYQSGGKHYCPKCMFDGSGKVVDGMSTRVRYVGPAADVARRIIEGAK